MRLWGRCSAVRRKEHNANIRRQGAEHGVCLTTAFPRGSFNSVGGCGQFLLRNEINYPDTSSRHYGFDCLPRPSYKIDYMIQWFQLPSTSVIGKVIKIRCVRGLSRFTENREMRLPSWHRLKPGVPRGKNVTSGYCLGPSLLSATQDLCDKGHQNRGHT